MSWSDGCDLPISARISYVMKDAMYLSAALTRCRTSSVVDVMAAIRWCLWSRWLTIGLVKMRSFSVEESIPCRCWVLFVVCDEVLRVLVVIVGDFLVDYWWSSWLCLSSLQSWLCLSSFR